MPRLLLEYASGRKSFVRKYPLCFAPRLYFTDASYRSTQARGAFIGAISSTSTTYALTPELRYALGFQPDLVPSPYTKVHREITEYTKGIQPLLIPDKLSIDEAAAMFEVWAKNRTLHTRECFLSSPSELHF